MRRLLPLFLCNKSRKNTWFIGLNLSLAFCNHNTSAFTLWSIRNSQLLPVTVRYSYHLFHVQKSTTTDVNALGTKCASTRITDIDTNTLLHCLSFQRGSLCNNRNLGSSSLSPWNIIKPFWSKTILLTILFFLSNTLSSSIAHASSASENNTDNFPSSKIIPESPSIKIHPPKGYWNIIKDLNSSQSEIQTANEKLFDYVVGTVNTLYYDNSGGANFYPKDFFDRWKVLKHYSYNGVDGLVDLGIKNNASGTSSKNQYSTIMNNSQSGDVYIPQLFWMDHDSRNQIVLKMRKGHLQSQSSATTIWELPQGYHDGETKSMSLLDSRESTVKGIKWLVSTLEDPYSAYLTREELQKELYTRDDGFLGLGAIVDIPPITSSTTPSPPPLLTTRFLRMSSSRPSLLSTTAVKNLPRVTAIVPDSPAERAGLVVGDRIVAVGDDKFLGLTRDQVIRRLLVYTGAENYFGYPECSIAKPLFAVKQNFISDSQSINDNIVKSESDELIGYKLSKVRLKTLSLEPFKPFQVPSSSIEVSSRADNNFRSSSSDIDSNVLASSSGGDSIVHWQLLTSKASIFSKYYNYDAHDIDFLDVSTKTSSIPYSSSSSLVDRVGYIRLTRFSRSSTAGFIKAIEELEKRGAQSYIIDLRNNYGGIIQEAMLTASSLLRDPHMVLCYTINSRGGFTPHDVEEYIIDTRYPGYLLSSESSNVALNQAKMDDPAFFSGDGWSPPSAFASLHEQRQTRGINPSSDITAHAATSLEEKRQMNAQKKIVILQNEGTASSAEVFVSSLKDNGRLVGTVGSKTYGKGLIQHTVPMPDGGGLRLTVAEYLTPSLQHVTKVGNARYDQKTGEFVGGGLNPDVFCDSRGIPGNVGADLCVGVAMDMLENAHYGDDAYKDM